MAWRDLSQMFPVGAERRTGGLVDGDVLDGRWLVIELPNPGGMCMCGCGEPAPIARETNFQRRRVKGFPMQFVHGHNRPRRQPHGGLPPHERYRVDDETECWIWLGNVSTAGYGQLQVAGKPWRAHRWMYERHRGPIPAGLQLDHLCRNRACVNPDHLEPVTNAENSRRGAMAKLTIDQVREIREAAGTLVDIGESYGVSASAVWMIKRGRTWREIQPSSTPIGRGVLPS